MISFPVFRLETETGDVRLWSDVESLNLSAWELWDTLNKDFVFWDNNGFPLKFQESFLNDITKGIDISSENELGILKSYVFKYAERYNLDITDELESESLSHIVTMVHEKKRIQPLFRVKKLPLLLYHFFIAITFSPVATLNKIRGGEYFKEIAIFFVTGFIVALTGSIKFYGWRGGRFIDEEWLRDGRFFDEEWLSSIANIFDEGWLLLNISVMSNMQVSVLFVYFAYFIFLSIIIAIVKVSNNNVNFKVLTLSLISTSVITIPCYIIFFILQLILSYKNFYYALFWFDCLIELWVILFSVKAISISLDISMQKAALSFVLPWLIISISISWSMLLTTPYLIFIG